MPAVIDTVRDEIEAFGISNPVPLTVLESEHYGMHIRFTPDGSWQAKPQQASVLKVEESTCLSDNDLVELHKQFSHCSADKLLSLLRNAGFTDNSFSNRLAKVQDECDVCTKKSRNWPRPCVGLPLAQSFNDVVAMDLHELRWIQKTWFVHFIDEYSRFSVAGIINNKLAETIVNALVNHWIVVLLQQGPPRGMHMDNGREFNNDVLRSLCRRYGITLLPTTPYSPWSNGLCERHNEVLAQMLQKTIDDDPRLPSEPALRHVVFAKNCLENHSGFTPYQLMLGKNPRLPSSLQEKIDPPALEVRSDSKTVADHFNLLEKTRSEFVT